MMWRVLILLLCLAPAAGAQTGDPGPRLGFGAADLLPDPAGGLRLRPDMPLPDVPSRIPVTGRRETGPDIEALRRLVRLGRAAGLAGVIYDNRDRGHSDLPRLLFPQVTRLDYAAELRARDLDYGLAGAILFPAILFGNSSTALTSGPAPRSLPRLAMTAAGGPAQAVAVAQANHLYVYPEHRDHDAVDLFPANWPYMLISQGSSGSDQRLLRAVGLILAALPPDTRARAAEAGLVVPLVQMILRQGGVADRAAYLSGAAHPTVFEGAALDTERMVTLAAALAPGDLPPAVVLTALAEDFTRSAGLAGQSERLFDTPQAIARIWRGAAFTRAMTVTAARTRDPNGRALRFHWVVLRGDPTAVRIAPFDAQGTTVQITLDWQDTRPVAPGDPRLTNRVDIGVFADNGVHLSAPAFVSVSFPAHEARTWAPGPDGLLRLAGVDYDAAGRKAAYDPILHWTAPWRDIFRHDAAGQITGWTRIATRPAGQAAAGEYDAQGRRNGRAMGYVLPEPGKPLGLRDGG